jgi:hypothetical protein
MVKEPNYNKFSPCDGDCQCRSTQCLNASNNFTIRLSSSIMLRIETIFSSVAAESVLPSR